MEAECFDGRIFVRNTVKLTRNISDTRVSGTYKSRLGDKRKLFWKSKGLLQKAFVSGLEEGLMKTEQKMWLDEYAVTCRIFKGRWSIRHCMKMYNDIKDLKIQMSSRAKGKVTRHESTYNPCERCKILNNYINSLNDAEQNYDQTQGITYNKCWAQHC